MVPRGDAMAPASWASSTSRGRQRGEPADVLRVEALAADDGTAHGDDLEGPRRVEEGAGHGRPRRRRPGPRADGPVSSAASSPTPAWSAAMLGQPVLDDVVA